jgi:carbamoyltransferase
LIPKVVGLWNGHDTSFAIFEDGIVKMHSELERHTRVKEDSGSALEFWKQYDSGWDDETIITSCWQPQAMRAALYPGHRIELCGHHLAHASHAYYSSPYEEALIFTFDAGGFESEDPRSITTCTISIGRGEKLDVIHTYPFDSVNIGGVWTRVTKYVFGYESGWPQGHQAGTVMALAALGDPRRYKDLFIRLLSVDMPSTLFTPEGHVRGMSVKDPRRPKHPFLGQLEDLANSSDIEKYDLAAGFQAATELNIRLIMGHAFEQLGQFSNVCLAGGVCLNSLAMGKIREWFPFVKNVYMPPCPSDSGLTLGSVQHHLHNVLKIPRHDYGYCFPPYLGKEYSNSEIENSFIARRDELDISKVTDSDVIELLAAGDIISIFNGRAESGRRALGNRSIVADPRDVGMKQKVNENVKHRQWFRPFAPSVLKEDVSIWFDEPQDSPYMGFVSKFSSRGLRELPAVLHRDGTGRLQTVTSDSNPWYYNFLRLWRDKSGTSVLLNTSFNDKSPIAETPQHAIDCFLGTDIDALYFPQCNTLLKKLKDTK